MPSDFPEDQGRDPAAAGDLELIGYLMTAETEAALAALQLSALPLARCDRRRVLLLSRGAVPVDRRLQDSLERQGAEVAVLRTTDYYALMVKPEQSQTPEATVAHVLGWLARGPAAAEFRSAVERRTPLRVRETPELEVDGGVVESPFVCSGSHGELFGIVSRDPSSGRAPLALVSAQRRGAAAHRAQPGLGRAGAALGGTGDPHGTARPGRDR